MSVADQGRVFLGMMLCGVFIGALHDALGVLRKGELLTAGADLLLAVLGAGCIIGAGLRLACDPFRLYAFLGAAAGWGIYAGSVGTIVRYLAKKSAFLSKKVKKQAENRQKVEHRCRKMKKRNES